MTEDEARAQRRFAVLSLSRFAAIALVFAGIANLAGKLAPGTAPLLGYALFFAGVGGFYGFPVLLKRRWRTPE